MSWSAYHRIVSLICFFSWEKKMNLDLLLHSCENDYSVSYGSNLKENHMCLPSRLQSLVFGVCCWLEEVKIKSRYNVITWYHHRCVCYISSHFTDHRIFMKNWTHLTMHLMFYKVLPITWHAFQQLIFSSFYCIQASINEWCRTV